MPEQTVGGSPKLLGLAVEDRPSDLPCTCSISHGDIAGDIIMSCPFAGSPWCKVYLVKLRTCSFSY